MYFFTFHSGNTAAKKLTHPVDWDGRCSPIDYLCWKALLGELSKSTLVPRLPIQHDLPWHIGPTKIQNAPSTFGFSAGEIGVSYCEFFIANALGPITFYFATNYLELSATIKWAKS